MAESDGISVQDEWWWLAHRSHGNKASILDILRVAAFSMSKMPCCSRFSVVLFFLLIYDRVWNILESSDVLRSPRFEVNWFDYIWNFDYIWLISWKISQFVGAEKVFRSLKASDAVHNRRWNWWWWHSKSDCWDPKKIKKSTFFLGNQTCRISAYRRRFRKHTEGAVRCCLQVYPFVSASCISTGCVVAPNMEHLCGTCWRHRQNCCCGQSQKRHPTTLRRSSAAVESAESLVESRIHKGWLCQTGWEACAKDVKTEGGTQLKRCLVSLCFAQWDCCGCVLDSYCRQSGYSRYRGTSNIF